MKDKKLQLLKLTLSFCFFVLLVFGARAANAATLNFSPSSGNFSVGNIFTVNVLVNTENITINNAEATVNFPSGLLEIVSLSKSGSIFSLWVEEPAFSNSAGTLSFNGGLPTPGFNGASGKVLSVVFRVKRAGSATVVFSSPAVRANDGYGTNVLRTGVQALYNLIAAEERPAISPTPVPEAPVVVTDFEISSSTHPNQDKWYSNNDPVFQIKFPSDARELNLVLSRNEKSTPQVRYTPPISEKIMKDVDEGVWYLHANYKGKSGLSQTITYKLQVDTGLPENLEVVRKDPEDKFNPSPKFELLATDNLSGISHYEAKVDNGGWSKLTPDNEGYYPLPPQTPGKQQLTIRAYDQAGNYIESSPQELQIDAPPDSEPVKSAWYLFLEPIFEMLGKGFDAVLNFIFNQWLLLLVLLVVGALVGQLIAKGVPHLSGEIEKIRYIASEYRNQKKLKKLDHKTKMELKILEKDIKKELDLLNKIAGHRPLHPEESYLKNKLDKYYNTLKKL